MNESKAPQTLQEAITFFATPWQAHDFLVAMRWNGNVTCPRCNSNKVGAFSGKRMVGNCKSCKKQFTVKVGTIFEDSPLSLCKWLPAVWMITNAKNGISSYELHRALGVTQKTAWFMLHRIRLALQNGTIVKLGGEVEADETFIGAKARNMHAKKKAERMQGRKGGSKHLTAVQGLLQRNGAEHSKVILKAVKTVRKGVIQDNVREYVLKGSNLFTDSLASYKGLKDEYNHQVIDHAVQYVDGKIHTNGLENFWSLLKRTVKGTYVNVEPFHLFRYLDEQSFRFNERKDDDGGRFLKAIKGIFGKSLSYASLTGKDGQMECLTA